MIETKFGIVDRIQTYLASVKCNCFDDWGGEYCTPCGMLKDALDYILSTEDNIALEVSNVEPDRGGAVVSGGLVEILAKEAGAGEDPGASGHKEGRRPAESKGVTYEGNSCKPFDGVAGCG